ncbi:MAG: cytochrome P450 [Deltaproteobacteria bacterium]|nr:cytochrome P450 [Deltaproteobacteria bacterium]
MDLDIEFLAAHNWGPEMHERLMWLQKNEPVYWSEKDQVCVVTRHDDVSYVSKNQQIFTSGQGVRPGNPAKLGLIDEDEPRHGNLRNMINKGFTPRMVKRLEVSFREITKNAIDAVAKDGECEFVESISVPLPLLLIAEMIGIRKEDRKRFHRWSDTMIAADGHMGDPEVMAKASQSFQEYAAYVTEIIEERRANPKDDLVSILVGAKDQGLLVDNFGVEGLDDVIHDADHMALANDELIMLLVILMVAGNETTRNGISGGVQLLIENPEERQKLIDDPSLINSAVEEMVRLVTPVRTFGRTVVEDTVLRGKEIKQGQTVLICYPSANRDPEVYEDADRFDVTRNPQHLGFGMGSHFCMGANLARMEMRVAIQEVLRRMPDMEYTDGGPKLSPSPLVRTCTEMKVKFTPEA